MLKAKPDPSSTRSAAPLGREVIGSPSHQSPAALTADRIEAGRGGRPRPIHQPSDYGVPLPAWLQACVSHVPPGSGESCPTDNEALLASAFDFAYQLHEGQFRASGEPYIIHPVAVADLLRDIGASAAVIAA
jgi:hypothetical protein